MRLSLRFIIPLAIALAAFAYAMVPLVNSLTLRWFFSDLDIRSSLIANTMQDTLGELVGAGNRAKMIQFFGRVMQDERVYAIGYCASPQDKPIATRTLPHEIRCSDLKTFSVPTENLLSSPRGPLYVAIRPVESEGESLGQLVIVHDMSYIERRSAEAKKYLFYFLVVLGAMVSLITVVIAQLSWRGWVQGMRALLRGEGLLRPSGKADLPELRPIARDLRALIRDIEAEHRPRDEDQMAWTAAALRAILHGELRGQDIIVVSNREPYIHVRNADAIEVQQPASGLVTAMEPIMRACSGTWIAHGSGSADREVVDEHDRVAVPPGESAYQLRRVWLSEVEESGYYYGFSNEGIWPLCHIAHVRPTFRSADWEYYVKVNRKFAQAVEQESKSPDPIVLVQDYHLALLPRMIRDALPGATVISFWHIPWPNPDAFSI
jgi:trehalose 6-phosphate synthase